MQLQGIWHHQRLTGVSDLHTPARIHAPPSERLRVGIAQPRDPASPTTLRVKPLTVGRDGTTGDAQADLALRTASVVDAYLAQKLLRNGIDGHGGSVELVIHAPDPLNAYWDKDAQRIELGDGDGVQWGSFAGSVSVMAHELYHGVIDAEVQLDYNKPEQAALHESFADVFSAGVIGSWKIGGDVVLPGFGSDVIRDLSAPAIAHLRDARQAGGQSHALSGVASLAAVRAAEQIGTDEMQQLWYTALVEHLADGAGFVDAARATAAAASSRHGADSKQHAAVVQAWESVGVLVAVDR